MIKTLNIRKVVLRPGLCDGCNRCVEACEKKINRDRKKGERKAALIKIIRSGQFYSPVICRNCNDAPCVTACMTGCRKQDENGLVMTDYRRCVGCWMCIMDCPFGAIERDMEDHIARKCEGCPDMETAPCVAACAAGVLSHAGTREYSSMTRRESAERFISGLVPA